VKNWIKAGLMAGVLTVVVLATSTQAYAYVLCSAYNGKACNTSASFVCYNQYPYEPGRCECFAGVWDCS
jgi:hypothetical protein